VSALLVTFGVFVAVLLSVLLWSTTRKPRNENLSPPDEDCFALPCQHLTTLPQIRQALELADIEYLAARGNHTTVKRVRRERRRVVLAYLDALREDFDRLMEATNRVAAFSQEVKAKHEGRRFALAAEFRLKHALLRVRFATGVSSFSGLANLVSMVSSRAIELDRVMTEIAAGAALADKHSRSAES
jgi:hypothetical protein